MFLGEFQHTLDPKGRVILPSAFREALREGLVMTVGLDNCLTEYWVDDWQGVVEGLRTLKPTDKQQRSFARMITSSAHPDVPDKQRRINIPARLRDYAGLGKDVTVVGADSRVELWDTARWESYRDQAMRDYANTCEAFNLGRA